MSSYNDAEELARLHTEEYEGGKPIPSNDAGGLTEVAMDYLQQIKELQEQLDEQIRGVQRLEMAILGYSSALQEEMSGKGH